MGRPSSNHEPSIAAARDRATEAGIGERVRFHVASAQDFPGATTALSAASTRCTTWTTLLALPATG